VALAWAAPAWAAPALNPLNVIPYDTFRASSSMTQADIQSFLNTLSGPLKSLNTTDYVNPGGTGNVGVHWKKGQPKKTAARIIYEAAKAWNLNPKVILSTLEKEESLLTIHGVSTATIKHREQRAMGCGIYPGSANTYAGFGNQIWNGTRKLSTYEITYSWAPGKKITVTAHKSVTTTSSVNGKVVKTTKSVAYKKTIVPVNASTFALYTYTPYYPQSLVWSVYVRYFGDPQTPARLQPVYRYRNIRNGSYYYTASEGQRYRLKSSSTLRYDGVAFTRDASTTASTSPLYRLRNKKTGAYFTTPWLKVKSSMLKNPAWKLDGTVCVVSTAKPALGVPVYRLDSKRWHTSLFTSSAATKAKLTSGSKPAFVYKGIAFYAGTSAPTTTPVGPASVTP
jgi:hypothetical protein